MKEYAAEEGIAIPEEVRNKVVALVEAELAFQVEQKERNSLKADIDERVATAGTAFTADPKRLRSWLSDAMEAHAALLPLVAPATPSSIAYTQAPRGFLRFVRKNVLLSSLIIISLVAVAGLVALLTLKETQKGGLLAARTVDTAVVALDKQADEIESIRVDDEQFAERLSTLVIDLEKQNTEIKQLVAADPRSSQLWPDAEIMLALTDLGDRNAQPRAAQNRIHLAVASFRDKLEAIRSHSFATSFLDQLLNICAALLGAAFFGLYTAHRYVVQRTFDRAYTSQYIVRLALGLVSGVILANFGEHLLQRNGAIGAEGDVLLLAKTLLALIGGYAADAVNAILTRVSETLQVMVTGKKSADDAASTVSAPALPTTLKTDRKITLPK